MSTTAAAALEALKGLRCVDLTYPWESSMPFFPGKNAKPFERVQTVTLEMAGVNSGRFSMSEHTGTHLDAPIHFIDGQISAERIPVDDLVAAAIVIDVTSAAAEDRDYRMSIEDVAAWEDRNGTVPDGCYVLMRSGWTRYWSDPDAYIGFDADRVMHHPAVSPAAAQVLVDRGVLGVGVDTLSVDNASPSDVRSPSHKILHGAGRYVIENLANLEQLPERDIVLFVGALPIVDGTAGSARVLAFIA
jgi:kynurenine formamidase